jgi:hypothetical protein
MKNFYEMLQILKNEQVKTPDGYILSPEEEEEYENEKSAMYKSLFLKDIDARRKAEYENSPEFVAAREKRKQQEDERQEAERQEKEKIAEKIANADPDYIYKIFGIIADSIEKSEGTCKGAFEAAAGGLGIQKNGNIWIFRKNNRQIPLYDKKLAEPATDRDKDYMRSATQLLWFAYEDSQEYGGCEAILDILYKLGIKPYLKVGDIVNFDGRQHNTKDGIEIYEKVLVSQPGLLDPFNKVLLRKADVKKLN